MIVNPEAYDIGRVKKFMKHLILTSKKSAERKEQKERFEKQVEKVKKLSLEKAPKTKLTREWTKLEKALSELVSTNKMMVNAQESNSMMLKRALEKIDAMSRNLSGAGGFSAVKKSLAEERLSELSGKMKSRFSEKGIEMMEGALERMKTPETRADIDAIEEQLKLLEKKPKQLKKSGKHDAGALKRLEGVINDSKSKLKSLKG